MISRFGGKTKGGAKRAPLTSAQYLQILKFARVGPYQQFAAVAAPNDDSSESDDVEWTAAAELGVAADDEDEAVEGGGSAATTMLTAKEEEEASVPVEWRWCANPARTPGVGEYPCGASMILFYFDNMTEYFTILMLL